MTAPMTTALSIPGDWQNAAWFFAELRHRPEISDAEWQVIVDWLRAMDFSEQNCLAGEAAAGLIRDRAPQSVIAILKRPNSPASAWQSRWREIVCGHRAEVSTTKGVSVG